MKSIYIVGVLLLLTGATALAEETTSVQNGTDSATVTQSGPQGDARRSVERSPGHTRIEQHEGSNAATITQDARPAAQGGSVPNEPDDDKPMPQSDGATTPRTQADVDGAVRERASPQGRANLDGLMDTLGLGAKTK